MFVGSRVLGRQSELAQCDLSASGDRHCHLRDRHCHQSDWLCGRAPLPQRDSDEPGSIPAGRVSAA